MRRLIPYILAIVSAFVWTHAVSARTVDPQSDSIAIVNMRAKMNEIRKVRPTVALVLSGGGAKGAGSLLGGAADGFDVSLDILHGFVPLM